jgi:hypothetical protein
MTNLITETHKKIGALITEGQRGLAKVDKALEKAQQKHAATYISFNQQMFEAGAKSKECVAKSLTVAQQKVLAGKGGDEKRDLIQSIGGRMGAMKKALERKEAIKAGTATDKRTKVAKAAKKVTASAKGTDTPAPNMAPESGEVTEAKGILPPAIRDPRLTTLFNQVAQLAIEDQAAFYEVAVKALAETLAK